jgi:hypothetical protein
MLSKIVFTAALMSITAVLFYYLGDSNDEARMEREAAGQLDALREHLFRR